MNGSFLTPTNAEIRCWLLATTGHVLDIEYYLTRLGIGIWDPQRPHDIMGEGNKLEWEAIKNFSLQFRHDIHPNVLHEHISAALAFHRQQYHHRMWNEPHPAASVDAMKLGAVDAICSLLESNGRAYQGGAHDFGQIASRITKNPPHKRGWLEIMLPEIARMERPQIEMTSLVDFRNPGMPADNFDIIRGRVDEVLGFLERERGIPRAELTQ